MRLKHFIFEKRSASGIFLRPWDNSSVSLSKNDSRKEFVLRLKQFLYETRSSDGIFWPALNNSRVGKCDSPKEYFCAPPEFHLVRTASRRCRTAWNPAKCGQTVYKRLTNNLVCRVCTVCMPCHRRTHGRQPQKVPAFFRAFLLTLV